MSAFTAAPRHSSNCVWLCARLARKLSFIDKNNRAYQEENHFIERTPYLYIGINTIRNNHQHKSEYEKHKLISAKQAKS